MTNIIFLEELVHVYDVPHSIFEAQMSDLLTAGRTAKYLLSSL